MRPSSRHVLMFNMLVLSVGPSFLLDSDEETRILKAGTATVIELPFKASPQPKVSWTYKDRPIKEKRIETETIRNMTCLRLSKSKREDSGSYKVVLSNDFGESSLTVHIIVQGNFKFSCLNKIQDCVE